MTGRMEHGGARGARLVLASVVLPAVMVTCGLGWLYLLRSRHLLGAGPPVDGALPLQQLSRGDAQPLLRVLAAWVAAGLAAGALVAALGPRRLLLAFAAGTTLLLVAAGAGSDAIVNNEHFVAPLAHQLSVPALAVALATGPPAALAGVLGTRAARRRSRGRTPKGGGAI